MKQISIILFFMFCIISLTAEPITNPEEINIRDSSFLKTNLQDTDQILKKANEYYNQKNYELSAKYYIAYLSYNPQQETALYNLACCYGLLSEPELSAKTLIAAYHAGFKDMDHILQDGDFVNVKASSPFINAVDSLKSLNVLEKEAEGVFGYYEISSYLPYRIYLPENFDTNKKYNLIIGLHGFGDTMEGFSRLWMSLKDKNCIFVAPEAPFFRKFDEESHGFSWSPFVEITDPLMEPSYLNLQTALVKMTTSLQKKYPVQNTWLFGFSQGCAFSYMIGLKNQEIFNGIIAFGGWLEEEVLTDEILEKQNSAKVFIAHGVDDRVINIEAAEKAYAKLTSLQYKVELRKFKGAHQIDRESLDEAINWLSAKKD